MKKSQIITAIVGAMLIGGSTEASALFPAYVQIFTAFNLLISGIMSVVIGRQQQTT